MKIILSKIKDIELLKRVQEYLVQTSQILLTDSRIKEARAARKIAISSIITLTIVMQLKELKKILSMTLM
jgi:hypothetical protein